MDSFIKASEEESGSLLKYQHSFAFMNPNHELVTFLIDLHNSTCIFSFNQLL
jgi:hypothetical protein